MGKYDLSMSPIQIGNITLKNRYAVGSYQCKPFMYGHMGELTLDGQQVETDKAKGGFGLIFTGSNYGDQSVDPFNPLMGNPGPLYAPGRSRQSFRIAARRAHQYGAKIFMQVAFGPGRMRDGKTPSPLPQLLNPNQMTTELTAEEIQRLIDKAIELSVYAKQNEYDGVEIHAHFGYLLDQFQMSITNHRTDEYGGDLDARLLVYKKLITGIKEACGKDFPVAIRMGLKTYMKSFTEGDLTGENEFGRDIDETIEVCKKLEEYGIDLFDFNSGTYESHYYCTNPYYMPKGYNIHLCKKAKEHLTVPVFCVGLMDDAEMCEQAIADGSIDGMTLCRPVIADPNYARKVAEGREEDIRPCIQCCLCETTNLATGIVSCSANPAALNEREYGIPKANVVKKVAVVGGGVAGMCATHTAATAGHSVTIYEKSAELGGHLNAIGAQPFKGGVAKLNKWYQTQLAKLGVEVKLNTELCLDCIKELDADVVILAVGSAYVVPEIPGIDGKNVLSAYEVMKNTDSVGENVVIIGGGCVGGEVAYDLAGRCGKKVTLVEQKGDIVTNTNSDDVHDMLVELLKYKNVTVKTNTRATEIRENGVVVVCDGVETLIEADTVIYATGVQSLPSMAAGLLYTGKEVYEVGDGVKTGTIYTASSQAYEISRTL